MLDNYELFRQLHKHCTAEKYKTYLENVAKEGYCQAILYDATGKKIALLAYQTRAYCDEGKLLYIRDFVTDQYFRGKGTGSMLLH